MALIFGTDNSEVINPADGVTDGDDEIYGLGGNDEIYGYGGNDLLLGGLGFDYLDGGDGIDTVYYDDSEFAVAVNLTGGGSGGTANGDTYYSIENIHGSYHSDFLGGDDLNNRIDGDLGNDLLKGFGGTDVLYGGDGEDIIEGGAGTFDSLYGEAGNDQLDGEDGNDGLNGGDGNDVLSGGALDDTLTGGLGADKLDGGDGQDIARYDALPGDFGAGAITIDMESNTSTGGHAEGDTLFNVERIFATPLADHLAGNSAPNGLNGLDGNDVLIGRADDDSLFGGAGDDQLDGGEGADRVDGGGDFDTASYKDSNAAVTIKNATLTGSGLGGHAEGDILVSIEQIIGSAHNDTLSGDAFLSNTLDGWDGNDLLAGGVQADVLRGGKGNDTASYANSADAVNVSLVTNGGQGGTAEGDALDGIENLLGSTSNDRLTGAAGRNRLDGAAGNDVLSGGVGNDVLLGGDGKDKLNGGKGDDRLTGGINADRFIYANAAFGADTVVGFENGKDLFDLRGSGLTFASFTESKSGADTLLTLKSDATQSILIKSTGPALIDADDFLI